LVKEPLGDFDGLKYPLRSTLGSGSHEIDLIRSHLIMQTNKREVAMPPELTLPKAMKSIRKMWHMTTTEFARELGVAQSAVSRYETGAMSPGRKVLLKLILKAREPERKTIREALSALPGKRIPDDETIRLAVQIVKDEASLERAAASFELPERARFAYLVGEILEKHNEVDESLNDILWTWLMTGHSPDRSRYFRDAARFLEIGLVPSASETSAASGSEPQSTTENQIRKD
jgi:DNA-binding transcriptional regulator YiaG